MTTSLPLVPVRPEVFPRRDQLPHFWSLTWTLARADLKQRYFGSVLGYSWTLLRPLMLFSVLYLVFTHIIRLGADVPHYPLVLLTSLALWTYFAETTGVALGGLVASENLMRKIRFPRFAIPLSITITTGIQLILNLTVVGVFIVVAGIDPRWSWLLAPLLVAVLVVFTLGVSLLLSTIFVKVRDLSSIWEVLVQLIFWASPIIYVINLPALEAHQKLQTLIACSPIADVLIEMRRAVIDPSAPSVVEAMGGNAWLLLVPIGIFVVVCVGGLALFAKLAPKLAEEL